MIVTLCSLQHHIYKQENVHINYRMLLVLSGTDHLSFQISMARGETIFTLMCRKIMCLKRLFPFMLSEKEICSNKVLYKTPKKLFPTSRKTFVS